MMKSKKYAKMYAHVLSVNKEGKILLSKIAENSKIPLFTSINDKVLNNLDREMFKMLNLDIFAANTHSILSNNKLNLDYTNKI